MLLCSALAAACPFVPAVGRAATPPPAALSLLDVLAAHLHARDVRHVTWPRTLNVRGTLDGLGLKGTFQMWRQGDRERYDETLGIRTQRTLRMGADEYVQNANGDVRVLRGIGARRQLTEDFIDSGEFARHPEDDRLIGRATLEGGRAVWQVQVTPPGGESYAVSLDARTWLVDQKAYADGDGTATVDYDDYRVIDGALVPFLEVDSDGDRDFDMRQQVTGVTVNQPIDAAVFVPFNPTTIDAAAPVSVPLLTDKGHIYARLTVSGKPMIFLIDSGSQGIFLDPGAAKRLGLTVEGRMEISAARRTNGFGVAPLDRIDIGSAQLPIGVVSVVDLSSVEYRGVTIDGVLGYPFFAAAEVRIDPDAQTMTVARPGTLKPLGTVLAVDTDRELPEIEAGVAGIEGRFLADTGDNDELLLFRHFVQAHPGVAPYAGSGFAPNRGVGGSSSAVAAMVSRLAIGPFTLYNRYSNVILSEHGAFADRNEAGNIGWGTLKNFIVTFDLRNGLLSLEQAHSFDDGRFRFGTEHM